MTLEELFKIVYPMETSPNAEEQFPKEQIPVFDNPLFRYHQSPMSEEGPFPWGPYQKRQMEPILASLLRKKV